VNENDTTVRLLEELAQRLQTTVEHLWSVLIRQAYVGTITYIPWLVVCVILLVAGRRLFRHTFPLWKDLMGTPSDERTWQEDEWFQYHSFVLAVSIAMVVGAVVIAATVSSHALVRLLNPEYWALQQVLRAVQR